MVPRGFRLVLWRCWFRGVAPLAPGSGWFCGNVGFTRLCGLRCIHQLPLVGHAHSYTVHFVSELTECAALSKRCHGQHYLSALVHVPLAKGSYLNFYLRTHIPFELDVTRCIRIEFVLDWLHLTPSTICRPPFAWAQTRTSSQMIRATPGAFPERLWSICPKKDGRHRCRHNRRAGTTTS